MSRIIEGGVPWWVGKVLYCQMCKTKFQVEHEDCVHTSHTVFGATVITQCPTCENYVVVNPSIDGIPQEVRGEDMRSEEEIAKSHIGREVGG